MKRTVLLAAAALAMVTSASAQEKPTVDSLLKSGFTVVGVITSTAGPGIFLAKGTELYGCFVAETPSSADIKTRYCKPVH